VRLVGEAGTLGYPREIGAGRLEHAAGAIETKADQIFVGRPADRLLERAREVRRRQTGLAGQHLDRQPRIQLGVDHLQRPAPGGR
jgi:hypothetical protein